MTKESAIKKINSLSDQYLNQDEKKMALSIIDKCEKEEVQDYLDFIMTRKRLGFHFDYAPELAMGQVSILQNNKKLNINVDTKNKVKNMLIIGENYEALKNLLVVYRGKINVIYIDPPYNTESSADDGNNSSYKDNVASNKFIYRDKYGRNGWLTMMKQRLELARNLLCDDGVIFISIDDSEQAYLKVLSDEIFGEKNFITTFAWKRTTHYGRQSKNVGKNVDYIHCYAKKLYKDDGTQKELLVANTISDFEDAPLYNASNNEKELDFPSGSVKFGIPDGTYSKTTNSKFKILEDVVVKNSRNQNALKMSFKSRWSQNKIDEEVRKGMNFVIKSNAFSIRTDAISGNKFTNLAPLQLLDESTKNDYVDGVGYNENGTSNLKEILGESDNAFSNPKPVSLIKYLISLYKNTSSSEETNNIKILDFFAGSGTTGQAVMELNAQDNKDRNFILCTNNENNIAIEKTYERLYRLINGAGTNGDKTFSWLNKNKPFSKVGMWVFDLVHFNVSQNDSKELDQAKTVACENFAILDKNYDTSEINVYYDLSGLNPYKTEEE